MAKGQPTMIHSKDRKPEVQIQIKNMASRSSNKAPNQAPSQAIQSSASPKTLNNAGIGMKQKRSNQLNQSRSKQNPRLEIDRKIIQKRPV